MTRIPAAMALALIALSALPARAQEASPDTSAWTRSLTGRLSMTQAGFHNWAEGGVNSLAASGGIDGRAERTTGAWTMLYELRAGLGVVRQDTLPARKAEDVLVAKAAYRYAGDGFFRHFNPTVALSARSQFTAGYDYKKAGSPKVSDFAAPASFMQSIGLTGKPAAWSQLRLGLSSKQTVVAIERLRELYSMDPDQSVRVEVGMEFFTDVDANLASNVHYRSSLGIFSAFNNPDAPDLIWENLLEMKVNSWLTTNFEWAMMLDEDRSDKLQMREVLSIGIVYHFM